MFLLCSVSAFAQDVIVKKDGSTVVCRVEKVTATEVTYKLWSDLKGSSFIIDKSLISAINYENGKKDTFRETESKYLPNNQNDGVQAMNDKALLKMDEVANNRWTYKKIKRLKTWGWIGGGVLVAGGVIILGTLAWGSHPNPNWYGNVTDQNDAALGAGIGLVALGIGTTTTCLVVAHKQKKKLDALQTSSLYRYDIPFSNGSSLSVGADMFHDRIMNKRTVGLGMTYNF